MNKSDKKNIIPRLRLVSLENTSLMRKFTVLYFFMSIVPVGLLYFLYLQVRDHGSIVIKEYDFFVLLTGAVILVAVGYFAMRSMIIKIIEITRSKRDEIRQLLGPEHAAFWDKNKNEISILAESFNEITSRLEENVHDLEVAKQTLHSVLSRVGEGLSSMENIDTFLNLILETITSALQAKTGILLLKTDGKNDLYIKTIFGVKRPKGKGTPIDPQTPLIKEIVESQQPLIIHQFIKEGPLSSLVSPPILASPLILHDDVSGIVMIGGRTGETNFDDEEKNLLQNIALQTAIALENAKLNEDIEKTYFETISALAMAVEAKDPYSRGHSDRVANFAIQIAQTLNLSPEDINTLRDAAKLHDIGKIGITDDILRKDGPLDVQETEMMKRHPEIGESIVKPVRSLRRISDIIRHHHEKLDGSGYPDGLEGNKIQLLVRIITIADIYDALTTNRPYRSSYSKEKAFATMKSMKTELDQHVVETFEHTFKQ